MRAIGAEVGRAGRVTWREGDRWAGEAATATVRHGRREPTSGRWSGSSRRWSIFAVGARVFWKRPRRRLGPGLLLALRRDGRRLHGRLSLVGDRRRAAADLPVRARSRCSCRSSACTSTWSSPGRTRSSRGIAGRCWASSTASRRLLVALWASMGWSRWSAATGRPTVDDALWSWSGAWPWATSALAVAIFVLCIACLVSSYPRGADAGRAEPGPVDPAGVAARLAADRATCSGTPGSTRRRWGCDSAAWPMFVVSLLYTLAYAMSITRYKLMQAEEILNRSVVYFLRQRGGGAALLGRAGRRRRWLIGDRLLADQTSARGAGGGADGDRDPGRSRRLARQRFQQAIDRRFFREKYKFDQAMRKMSLAVGSLVDRADAGPPAAGGGGRGAAAGVGGDLPGEAPRRPAASWRPATARARRADAGRRQPAGRAAQADARRSGCRTRCRRPALATRPTDAMIALGGEVAARARGRRRAWPACSSSARSGAACPTRTRRSPSSAPSARSPRWPCTRPGIQQTLEGAQPRAARQGREDRRAAAADPDPPGPARRPRREPATAAGAEPASAAGRRAARPSSGSRGRARRSGG